MEGNYKIEWTKIIYLNYQILAHITFIAKNYKIIHISDMLINLGSPSTTLYI